MSFAEPWKQLSAGMRTLLYIAAVLVFLAGVQLFVFPERTDRYFAWTVDPPLTAAFLGAAYWSSVAFEVVAARQRRWADARIAVPTVFVFTVLTLAVTLGHIDRFHLGPEFEVATQAVTWAWIAIYAVVPVVMAGLLVVQWGQPGEEPERMLLPAPSWLVAAISLHALMFLGLGAALLIAPDDAAFLWPWELTPLTGRAIGAWLFGLGVAAAHALWERDIRRLRPAAAAYLLLGVLQTVALLRYLEVPDWSSPAPFVYVAVLGSVTIVGVATFQLDRTGTSVRSRAVVS